MHLLILEAVMADLAQKSKLLMRFFLLKMRKIRRSSFKSHFFEKIQALKQKSFTGEILGRDICSSEEIPG